MVAGVFWFSGATLPCSHRRVSRAHNASELLWLMLGFIFGRFGVRSPIFMVNIPNCSWSFLWTHCKHRGVLHPLDVHFTLLRLSTRSTQLAQRAQRLVSRMRCRHPTEPCSMQLPSKTQRCMPWVQTNLLWIVPCLVKIVSLDFIGHGSKSHRYFLRTVLLLRWVYLKVFVIFTRGFVSFDPHHETLLRCWISFEDRNKDVRSHSTGRLWPRLFAFFGGQRGRGRGILVVSSARLLKAHFWHSRRFWELRLWEKRKDHKGLGLHAVFVIV